ncbi:MAG: DNA cytosine methyltransferase [Verrucomicrobia bacterium]|nr:DNA cytosine methyltransferase [Verrucomicrobiota bacterium]MBV9657188.1 DNA cytosine methyltransferase [Verrucomicrobiota bacterium]
MKKLTAIDVCAGAGGWAVAARGLPIEIVAAFDRADDCLATYARNHPGVETVRCDVSTHDFRAWKGGVDLILGGIPCEQISDYRAIHKSSDAEIAGFAALIDKCLALPRELGARWWCYEDVARIEKLLPPLTPHFMVDAQSHSAQRRMRAFIGNCPMPERGTCGDTLQRHLRRGPYRIGSRLVGRQPSRNNAFKPDTFYPWEPAAKSPCVITLTSRRDSEAATRHGEQHWRQLEWQELASLQGFPDDYLFVGSPSRVTKMIAQAVQIDTARAILQALVALAF